MAIRLERTKLDEPKKELVELEAPPADLEEAQADIEEVSARFKRHEISLDDDEHDQIARELDMIINGWKDSRSHLVTKLREWNDLFEGVTFETDFPWPGASSLHVPMPKIKAREIHSVLNRSGMRPIPFLVAQYAGPDEAYQTHADLVKDIEDFTEDKIRNATNIHEVLTDALIPVIRDGTAVVQIIWETQWETVFDYKTYPGGIEGLEAFTRDYPSAEAADVSDERYGKILDKIEGGKPHEIRYEYEVPLYDGPKAYLVPLIDFVHWPVYEPDIEMTDCHGKRIWYTENRFRQMLINGRFNERKERLEEILNGKADVHDDDLTASRDEIEGIARMDGNKAKEFEFYELVYRTSISESDRKNNVKRKYLIWFHAPSKTIARIEPYSIRKGRGTYFPLRILKRDGRFLGMSLMDDIMDLSMEIDILHRQRINSRTITHVPTFKAKESAKNRFNPEHKDMRFRPGRTFWLNNLDDVEVFDVRPVDLSGSVDEELLLYQLIDMVTGSISGQSGQANPIDSRAPARKEQMLLRQSTQRIDDYLASLIPTFGKIGQHVVDLYYQFGPDRIKFFATVDDEAKIEKEIERSKLFNPNVFFRVNGTSVFMNPELEFNRMLELYQIVGSNPITAQNPRILREALQRVIRHSRVPDDKAFIPTNEELGLAVDDRGMVPSEDEKRRLEEDALRQAKDAARINQQEQRARSMRDLEVLRGTVRSDLQRQKADLDLANEVGRFALPQPPSANGGVR